MTNKEVIVGIVTRIDLLNFVTSRESGHPRDDSSVSSGRGTGMHSPA